jgi:hypothetical protein
MAQMELDRRKPRIRTKTRKLELGKTQKKSFQVQTGNPVQAFPKVQKKSVAHITVQRNGPDALMTVQNSRRAICQGSCLSE